MKKPKTRKSKCYFCRVFTLPITSTISVRATDSHIVHTKYDTTFFHRKQTVYKFFNILYNEITFAKPFHEYVSAFCTRGVSRSLACTAKEKLSLQYFLSYTVQVYVQNINMRLPTRSRVQKRRFSAHVKYRTTRSVYTYMLYVRFIRFCSCFGVSPKKSRPSLSARALYAFTVGTGMCGVRENTN